MKHFELILAAALCGSVCAGFTANVRDRLATAFDYLKNKKKARLWRKHGNIPQ